MGTTTLRPLCIHSSSQGPTVFKHSAVRSGREVLRRRNVAQSKSPEIPASPGDRLYSENSTHYPVSWGHTPTYAHTSVSTQTHVQLNYAYIHTHAHRAHIAHNHSSRSSTLSSTAGCAPMNLEDLQNGE